MLLGLREPLEKGPSLSQGCTMGPFSHLVIPGTQRMVLLSFHRCGN